MKLSLIFFIILLASHALAQDNKLDLGVLQHADEEVIFAFQAAKGEKMAAVCKQKQNKYLVYRFGTKNRIDLQYPTNPDSTSWQQFTFKGYSRSGGPENLAYSDFTFSFENNDAQYEIYDDWNSTDESYNRGIMVTINSHNTEIKAGRKVMGTLALLNGLSDYIENQMYK